MTTLFVGTLVFDNTPKADKSAKRESGKGAIMKITIKTMRHELVLEEVEQIRMMNDRECYNFAADTSGYLGKENYSDDEITELYNNILGGQEDDE